jgi:hypothetical protein
MYRVGVIYISLSNLKAEDHMVLVCSEEKAAHTHCANTVAELERLLQKKWPDIKPEPECGQSDCNP